MSQKVSSLRESHCRCRFHHLKDREAKEHRYLPLVQERFGGASDVDDDVDDVVGDVVGAVVGAVVVAVVVVAVV
jgi:hypothetical protein